MSRAVLIGAAYAVLAVSTAAFADLASDLAKQFNAEPRFFVLNLPPRPGGWPGSIYTPDMRMAVIRGRPDDPALEGGPIFDMTAGMSFELGARANTKVASWFGLSSTAMDVALASFTLRNARIHELTLGNVRERVLALPEPERRPPGPVVVYRAYEGVPTLTLGRRSEASAEAWAAFKKGVAEAAVGATAAVGDNIVLESRERVIVGFEIVQASDLVKLALSTNVIQSAPATGAGHTTVVVSGGTSAASGTAVTTGGSTASTGGGQAGTSASGGSSLQVRPGSLDFRVTDVLTFEATGGPVLSSSYGLTRVPAHQFEQAYPTPEDRQGR